MVEGIHAHVGYGKGVVGPKAEPCLVEDVYHTMLIVGIDMSHRVRCGAVEYVMECVCQRLGRLALLADNFLQPFAATLQTSA